MIHSVSIMKHYAGISKHLVSVKIGKSELKIGSGSATLIARVQRPTSNVQPRLWRGRRDKRSD